MHEPNEDVAGYIAARVLGEDSETPPQQPLHAMSLRLPYEMAAYLIELAGTTDTSRVEMARQLRAGNQCRKAHAASSSQPRASLSSSKTFICASTKICDSQALQATHWLCVSTAMRRKSLA